jgi:26S proteasome regulatory subunit N5
MSKKHGQLKEAVVRMVDESMTWLPELKEKKDKGEYKGGKDRWLELLNTLRDITEGKVSQLNRPQGIADERSISNWQGRG